MATILIPINSKFGKLTVISRGKNAGSQATWICQCECGKETTVLSQSLRRGVTKSCGSCGKLGHPGYNRLQRGEYAFRVVVKTIKEGAESRNLPFTLSLEEARKLVTENCHYCNRRDTAVSKPKNSYGEFKHIGIDRVVNEQGYTPENCVPCCFDCNVAKSRMSHQEFIAWAHKVKKHLSL